MSPQEQLEESVAADTDHALQRLRALILARTEDRLRDVEDRLQDRERFADDVAGVLPQAVVMRTNSDARLAASLAPTIESALHTSIQNNPERVTEAIFPILGPAIRKSISHAMAGLVENVNQSLESTFTVRGLRARLEARRTGQSYAEVLLARSLLYQVEEIFLIHNETGLLLQHVQRGAQGHDADLVSGMLTAISDFVRDSFKLEDGESLSRFQVGELTVLVERGPRAALAAVVRGQPPLALRTMLAETLEAIHAECHGALATFEGDDAPFATVRPLLTACLIREQKANAESRRKSGWRRWLIPVIVGCGLVAGVTLWGRSILRKHELKRHVGNVASTLDAHPGIQVIGTEQVRGKWTLRVAVDPEARADAQALVDKHVRDRNDLAVERLSLHLPHPPYVLARARRALAPPEGIHLQFADGTLRVDGLAPAAWRDTVSSRLVALAEIHTVDAEDVVSPLLADLYEAAQEIEQATVHFAPGTDREGHEAQSTIERVGRLLDALAVRAKARGIRLRVDVRAGASSWTRSPMQRALDIRRADATRARLANALTQPVDLSSGAELDRGDSVRFGFGPESDRAHCVGFDVRFVKTMGATEGAADSPAEPRDEAPR